MMQGGKQFMHKSLVKKGLVFGIIVLFIGASVAPLIMAKDELKTPNVTIMKTTWFVKGDGDNNNSGINWSDAWRDINYAINYSSVVDGDTIRVGDGTYYENVAIVKQLTIEGNGSSGTIIDGNNIGDAIHISADGVNISKFMIKNCGNDGNEDFGIDIRSNFNSIFNNIIIIDTRGIRLEETSGANVILNNSLTSSGSFGHGGIGISISHCENVTIRGNSISNYFEGIGIYHVSTNVTISENTIFSNSIAIQLDGSSYQNIRANNISNNHDGIRLFVSKYNDINNNRIMNNYKNKGIGLRYMSDYNSITNNHIINNSDGIYLHGSNDNRIINNNFQNINDDAVISTLSIFNTWNGNYWRRPRILPKPIIGDLIASIPWINFDWHPALRPYDIPQIVI